MELWNRNVYIDLNERRQNLKTKQIKSRMFSYVFLTSITIRVLINSDSFYDTLGSIATLKVQKPRLKSQKKNVFSKRGNSSFLYSTFEMHFMVI